MYKLLFTTLILCLFAAATFAQQPDTVRNHNKTDSINRQEDKITSQPFVPKVKKEKVYHPDSTHIPHVAVIRSLEVPGWGQLYNHQWWKVPFIYGGLGALAYSIYFNHSLYISYENAAIAIRNGGQPIPKYRGITTDYTIFETAANSQFRNYELSVLGFVALWGVNVVDAYIQAKFQQSYTMDTKFGMMRIAPDVVTQSSFASNNIGTFTPVLKLTFVLK